MPENASRNGRGVWEDGMATAESIADFPAVGLGIGSYVMAASAAGRLP
jgi:hypothetical protein